jgi:hypothetical protein
MKHAVEMGSGGMTIQCHGDRFRHFSDIAVITAIILRAVMLVLLLKGNCEVHR